MTDGEVGAGSTPSVRAKLRANGKKRAQADRLRREARAELGALLVAAVAEGMTVGEAAREAGLSREAASKCLRQVEQKEVVW